MTAPALWRKDIGRLAMSAIEAKARTVGLSRLLLETGRTPGFEQAWAVCERSGFRRCCALFDCPDSGFSRFYGKNLS